MVSVYCNWKLLTCSESSYEIIFTEFNNYKLFIHLIYKLKIVELAKYNYKWIFTESVKSI